MGHAKNKFLPFQKKKKQKLGVCEQFSCKKKRGFKMRLKFKHEPMQFSPNDQTNDAIAKNLSKHLKSKSCGIIKIGFEFSTVNGQTHSFDSTYQMPYFFCSFRLFIFFFIFVFRF